MHFFDITNVAIAVMGYPVSYVELIGTLFGLISVFYASRANIVTWPTGIINELFLFILFFQVQLYADMFLQVYFFIVTIYGWYHWKTSTVEKKVSATTGKGRLFLLAAAVLGTVAFGCLFRHIHILLPAFFTTPAAYPFADSFVMVLSILATVLLARKKIENWVLWITGDVVCVVLYFKKEIYFLSLEYLIFLGLASYGLYHWNKTLKHG
ncbi:nicotinamide mononucleotide transporter [Niastella yeongjuensis]|uniref:Nicotinamide riboside transporter PnuC n=2 Tax=Niastella yeongjuensis TaxID=354355 RepID=A0A1V9FCS7_9BACT|nr:nicotinamide mononucleotide transporter [Niastella yeongjuensis]SEP47376.1 nicotinamide mononucleotide transporter [Niastella yeongjuensis]